MAYIDKTYVDTWKKYCQLKDWCNSIGTTIDDYGNRITPMKFLNVWKENDFERVDENQFGGLPVWNTPEYFDVWLIRNCPLEFIQDRLKEQYGEEWSKVSFTDRQEESEYQLIKEHRAKCDLYKRNGLGNKSVMTIDWTYNNRFNDNNLAWWVDILPTNKGDMWWYNEERDTWINKGQGELGPWTCSHYISNGHFSLKRVLRLIRKWNLPEGTRVHFSIDYKRYIQKEFVVTVRHKKSRNLQREANKIRTKMSKK